MFRSYQFLKYSVKALGPHSLHSPFLYSLFNQVIKPSKSYRIKKIEKLRKELLSNNHTVKVMDFKSGKTLTRTISLIARTSVSNKKFSSFLNLLITFLKVSSVLETGTSLGINALYLAHSVNSLVTIEGSEALASLARKNFKFCNKKNIRLVKANMYQALESEIIKNKPDFIFLDADHRSTAVAFCINLILKHTPSVKCIVIHDIYWSRDMYEMWNQLIDDPRFTLSIDIFQAGLLFPQLSMEKQHFKLCF
ncbi:MAG: class I SAM-dependent methyltransferase [Bacteroidota bacterium]